MVPPEDETPADLAAPAEVPATQGARDGLRFLVDGGPLAEVDGFVELAVDGALVGYSRSLLDVYGVGADERAALARLGDVAAHQRALTAALARKVVEPSAGERASRPSPSPGEATFEDVPLLDGRVVERYGVPLRRTDGALAGRLFVVRDVTARRRAESELRARNRQQEAIASLGARAVRETRLDAFLDEAVREVRTVLDAGTVHLLEAGAAGRFVVRASAAREGTVSGDAAECAHLEGGASDAARGWGITVPVRGRAAPFGLLCTHWPGPHLPTHDEAHFVDTVANTLSAAIGRQQAEQAVALADRMASVGTLAAGVAHELNNPLAGMVANLAYVAERLAPSLPPGTDGDDVRDALAEARQAGERMRGVIRDLQVFARGEDGALEDVDLRRVAESALGMAANEIRRRAAVVRALAPVPPVRAAEGRLAQVVLNLLVNAAQSIPEGAAERHEIRVTTGAAPGGRVRLEVADTGRGIPPEDLKHVFDPFFTTRPLGGGKGLGLPVCRGIVLALGGTIEVESEPDRGSVFRVLLPAAPPRSIAAPEPQAPAPGRLRILVVDDEPLLGAALRRGLAAEHDVTVAGGGAAALERVERGERWDVILTDLLMPDVTGMDLFAAIEARDPALAARMLFMTGGAFTPAARAFVDRMSGRCLVKPFEVSSLAPHLARLAADRTS